MLSNSQGNVRINDAAIVAVGKITNASTSIVVIAANSERRFFQVNNDGANQGVWIRLYPSADDDLKRGIFLNADSFWEMPSNAIYTGEISAIAASDSPNVYSTEY